MALCSPANQESRKFTLLNCPKKFSSDSITILRRPLHTRQSKIPCKSSSENSKRRPCDKKAETARKNNEQLTNAQAGIQLTREQRQNAQALKARLQHLQQDEDDLLHRIGEIENLPEYLHQVLGRRYTYYKNPARADLPYLQSHLNDVR